MDVIITILSCATREPTVPRSRWLNLLPTVELPLTQALESVTHVLGRQQLKQEMQQLIVPPGKKSPSLERSRVVSAPPRETISAGSPTWVTKPVTANAPLSLAIFRSFRRPPFVLRDPSSPLTVRLRLLEGPKEEPNLKDDTCNVASTPSSFCWVRITPDNPFSSI